MRQHLFHIHLKQRCLFHLSHTFYPFLTYIYRIADQPRKINIGFINIQHHSLFNKILHSLSTKWLLLSQKMRFDKLKIHHDYSQENIESFLLSHDVIFIETPSNIEELLHYQNLLNVLIKLRSEDHLPIIALISDKEKIINFKPYWLNYIFLTDDEKHQERDRFERIKDIELQENGTLPSWYKLGDDSMLHFFDDTFVKVLAYGTNNTLYQFGHKALLPTVYLDKSNCNEEALFTLKQLGLSHIEESERSCCLSFNK